MRDMQVGRWCCRSLFLVLLSIGAFVPPASARVFEVVKLRYGGVSGTIGQALIVANTEYDHINSLTGPVRDAEQIADALASRGVAVHKVANQSPAEILKNIRSFADAPTMELFVFYYAGHAAQFHGDNRLITKEFNFSNADTSTLSIDSVIAEIGKLGFSRILIAFDACRDLIEIEVASNPGIANGSAPQLASATRGLSRISNGSVPLGTVAATDFAISFSSSNGQVALDAGPDGTSPYSTAFADGFRRASGMLEFLLGLRSEVARATDNQQNPAVTLQWSEDYRLSASIQTEVTLEFGGFAEAPDIDLTTVKVPYEASTFTNEWGVEQHIIVFDFADTSCDSREFVTNDETLRNRIFVIWEDFYCATGELPIGGEGDDVWYLADRMVIDTDFDQDNRNDRFDFSWYREGGSLTTEISGRKVEYTGPLGSNLKTFGIFEMNGDRVNDIFIEFQRSASEHTAIVILDGHKLRQSRGRFGSYDSASEMRDRELSNYLSSREHTGVLGGVGSVAIFYDSPLKQWFFESPSVIRYTTYSPTIASSLYPPNYMVDKVAHLGGASIRIDFYGGHEMVLNPVWQIARDVGLVHSIDSRILDGSVRAPVVPIRVDDGEDQDARSGSAVAPSFDCGKATTITELAICGSPKLAALDARLAAEYVEQLRSSINSDDIKVRQRAWLRERNACRADSACLEQAYNTRLRELEGQ